MERSGLKRAAKLLGKAVSTDSDHEAVALAAHAYRLVARAITEYDLEQGETVFGAPRRERRLLADRRGRGAPATVIDPLQADSAGARYVAFTGITERAQLPKVNLQL
jgi:hypothetical protein